MINYKPFYFLYVILNLCNTPPFFSKHYEGKEWKESCINIIIYSDRAYFFPSLATQAHAHPIYKPNYMHIEEVYESNIYILPSSATTHNKVTMHNNKTK